MSAASPCAKRVKEDRGKRRTTLDLQKKRFQKFKHKIIHASLDYRVMPNIGARNRGLVGKGGEGERKKASVFIKNYHGEASELQV